MQSTAAKIKKIEKNLNKKNGFNEKNTEILKEATGILAELNERTERLIEPTDELFEALDEFGGPQNPMMMFISFIYRHIDDYFEDGLIQEILDLDDEPF